MSIVKSDGNALKIEKLSNSVTLRLSVNETSGQDLSGIYFIVDDGSLEYVGGTYASNKMIVEVSHFSELADLNYDKSFEDINASYWAFNVIKKMSVKQMVFGVSETVFAPKQNVTRAEFASLIGRALSLDSSKYMILKAYKLPSVTGPLVRSLLRSSLA